MATKKLRNFEYAYHLQDFKGGDQIREASGAYKTLNGYAMVLCSSLTNDIKDTTAAELALERISYYLNNEYVDDPREAVFSALIYASGFIFEYARKNPLYEGMKTACLCVLIRDNRVYYANIGGNGLYFFDRKKLYPLACSVDNDEKNENMLLGSSPEINPFVCEHPFIPVENDVLLICSQRFLYCVSEKAVKSILSDPMPLLTKVSRLVDIAAQYGEAENISVQLISFYNIDHEQRSFVPTGEPDTKSFLDDIKIPRIIKHPIGNMVILGLIFLFFMYMVWDLFIYNPMPVKKVEVTSQAQKQEVKVVPDEVIAPTARFVVPNDTIYAVRSGDTWGMIYQRFGVCSWFIRNHKPNIGKFDRANNPVAGTRINIPLIYSSKQEFNPDFFTEFSTAKVGSACQNANESFIKAFEQTKLNRE